MMLSCPVWLQGAMILRSGKPLLLFMVVILSISILSQAFTGIPVPQSRSPRPQASGLKAKSPRAADSAGDVTRRGVVTLVSLLSSVLWLPRKGLAEEAGPLLSYTSPTSGFSFSYPGSMKAAPKLVKTHLEELTLKSEIRKGFSVGVAVDPVKIVKIEDIGTPAEVGKRIVSLELKKEGVTQVELLDSRQSKEGSEEMTYYSFDYAVESTRGEKRYLAKAAVKGGRLYVLTVEVKKPEYDEAKAEIDGVLQSFRVNA